MAYQCVTYVRSSLQLAEAQSCRAASRRPGAWPGLEKGLHGLHPKQTAQALPFPTNLPKEPPTPAAPIPQELGQRQPRQDAQDGED